MWPLAPGSGSAPAGGVSSPRSDGLVIGHLQLVRVDLLGDERAHQPLLLGDAAGGLDHLEPVLVHEPIVLPQDLSLEHPKAVDRVCAPAEIHTCLVEFELDT